MKNAVSPTTVPKIQKILTIDDGFKVVCPRRRCDDDATTVRARKWCVPDDGTTTVRARKWCVPNDGMIPDLDSAQADIT